MKLYLATGNKHKQKEMQEILPGYHIVIPADEGIDDFDPDETGDSFVENSLIKARALWDIVRAPVIADDSGLCVDCLNGIPGIYTSRYAGAKHPKGYHDGRKIPQEEQNRLLIEQVNATGSDDRRCHYTCAMVLVTDALKFYSCEEYLHGEIIARAEDAAGTGGFGYDPIVFLPAYGKTAAQISAEEKNCISHRGKAARGIAAILADLAKNGALG